MDWVQRGGPWTGSKGVVHGPVVHVLYTSLLPGQCNDREGIMQMKGPIFRLARGILLHLCDNVASSYINILWISCSQDAQIAHKRTHSS